MNHSKTKYVKDLCLQQGFDVVGIAKTEYMDEEARLLEAWLRQGAHGKMHWMENHFDLRVDPTLLVPGAKSVISLMHNYYAEETPADDSLKVAKYAWGKDYHRVLKKKLKNLVADMQSVLGDFNARIFVDSAPVLERDWAKRSGLGWIGKNTLLIHPKKGSYYFLAEIILDVEMDYDQPMPDHCGTCTRCIDACPTDAIAENGYWLDASKCISYLTIEYRDEFIPEPYNKQMEGWIFGCDICQNVCPWNRFSAPHKDPKLSANPELLNMRKADWVELTEEVFERLASGSAIRRAKFGGLKRNILSNVKPIEKSDKKNDPKF